MNNRKLTEKLGKNLIGGILDINTNEYGSDADKYIDGVKQDVIELGYIITRILKDTNKQVYQIHFENKAEDKNN